MATPSTTPPQGTDVASNGNGLSQAQNVTTQKKCKKPFCNNLARLGDYCGRHGGGFGIQPGIPDPSPPQPVTPSPKYRELQRQLDRLEGKIDSLIAALGEDDTDDTS